MTTRIYGTNKLGGVVKTTKNIIPYALVKEESLPGILKKDGKPIYYYSFNKMMEVLNEINGKLQKNVSLTTINELVTHAKLKENYPELTTLEALLKPVDALRGVEGDLISQKNFAAFDENLELFFPQEKTTQKGLIIKTPTRPLKRLVEMVFSDKKRFRWCPTRVTKVGDKDVMTEYGFWEEKIEEMEEVGGDFRTIVRTLLAAAAAANNNGKCVLDNDDATTIYTSVVGLLKKKHKSSFILEKVHQMMLNEEEEEEPEEEEQETEKEKDEEEEEEKKKRHKKRKACLEEFSILVGVAKVVWGASSTKQAKYKSFKKVEPQPQDNFVQLVNPKKLIIQIRSKLYEWNKLFGDFRLGIQNDLGRDNDNPLKYLWYFFIVELLLYNMLKRLILKTKSQLLTPAEIVENTNIVKVCREKIQTLYKALKNQKIQKDALKTQLLALQRDSTGQSDKWLINPSDAFAGMLSFEAPQGTTKHEIKYLSNKEIKDAPHTTDLLHTLAKCYIYFLEIKPMTTSSVQAQQTPQKATYANVKLLLEEEDLYRPYPNIQDERFYTKLHAKKEFQLKDAASDGVFEISPQQQWVANYLATSTPYNGILLYWGTGVGKTCASISICEQNLDYYKKNNKKILIIASVGTMENYKKELFSTIKDKEEQAKGLEPGSLQCTGSRYYVKPQRPERQQTILAKINEDYEFLPHTSIKSKLNELLLPVNLNVDQFLGGEITERARKKAHAAIASYFSGRLIVIDEIQNIREQNIGGEEEAKKSTFTKQNSKMAQLLQHIVELASNIKLVLMTATPMYDKATEIVYLLNLLLLNDRRTAIAEHEFFNRDGEFKTNKKKDFMHMLKGYVSYVRGNNPKTFPTMLHPGDEGSPTVAGLTTYTPGNMADISGARNFTFVKCKLSEAQKLCLVRKKEKEKEKESSVAVAAAQTKKSTSFDVAGKGIVCCFMAYPNNVEFDSCFTLMKQSPSLYENDAINKHIKKQLKSKSSDTTFLDPANLALWSPKMKLLIDCIKAPDSSGIIFISANYLSIAKSVALILSYYGMKPYHRSTPRLNNKMTEQPPLLQGSSSYVYFGAEMDVADRQAIIDVCNHKDNMNGEKIRVIIGTSVMDEGVDLKNIRQIHILSPWHNFARLDQIIGRGIRHNSHELLPRSERNTTVFMYCSTYEDDDGGGGGGGGDVFTTDEKYYKRSLEKDLEIKKVELILRNTAVDCRTNIEGNKYKEMDRNNTRNTAYTLIKNYSCVAEKADAKDKDTDGLNTNTFNPVLHARDTINRYKKAIQKLFLRGFVFSLPTIAHNTKVKTTEEAQNMYYALAQLMTPNSLTDKYDRLGRLVFEEGFYHFQPAYLDQVANLPEYYRRTKATAKPRRAIILRDEEAEEGEEEREEGAEDDDIKLVYEEFAKMCRDDIIPDIKKKDNLPKGAEESMVAYVSRLGFTTDDATTKAKIGYFMDRLKTKITEKLMTDLDQQNDELLMYKVMKDYLAAEKKSKNSRRRRQQQSTDGIRGILEESKTISSSTIQENLQLRVLGYTKSVGGTVCSSIAKKLDATYNKQDLYKKITKTDAINPSKLDCKQIELAMREHALLEKHLKT